MPVMLEAISAVPYNLPWRWFVVTAKQEQEWREEAERLKLLPLQTQHDLIGAYRHVARDSKLSQAQREEALRKANTLAKLLGLSRRQ
jgi:hypothetical protein